MNQVEPLFYRMVSDPYQGLKSIKCIDRSMSRAGNVSGPFEQPYLAENGYGLTSIGSGYPRNFPPDFFIFEPRPPLSDVLSDANSFIVNNKTRALFEKLCAQAFDFFPAVVKIRDRSGQDLEVPGYQLCDVIDFQDNIDVARSDVVWHKAMPKFFET
jgi:hypothetical protein